MKTWTIVALVVIAAVFPGRIPSSLLAHAQSPKYPHIEKKIIEIGPKWNDEVRDTMPELYTPILKKVVNSSVKRVKDIRYGSHKRHRLDVYTPRKPSSSAMPVLVYMHGRRGDRCGAARRPRTSREPPCSRLPARARVAGLGCGG